ncbi:MAG: helix-turn-helix transcriptional regulator [Bacteroidales bacterium]
MVDRIKLLMETQNMTATEFAEAIGIQRSGLSHIMSGRNKASLDFVQKLLKRFPEVSPDWLISGKGGLLRRNSSREGDGMLTDDGKTEGRLQVKHDRSAVDPRQRSMFEFDRVEQEEQAPYYKEGNQTQDAGAEKDKDDGQRGERRQRAAGNRNMEGLDYDGNMGEDTGMRQSAGNVKGIPATLKGKRIAKVLLLYQDGSFESFDEM